MSRLKCEKRCGLSVERRHQGPQDTVAAKKARGPCSNGWKKEDVKKLILRLPLLPFFSKKIPPPSLKEHLNSLTQTPTS